MNISLSSLPLVAPRQLGRVTGRPRRTVLDDAVQRLEKRRTLDLGDAHGATLVCTAGSLWLTHDGDCRDVILECGHSHVCDRHERLIVQALETAVFRVVREREA